jgi:hypothetical protein
MFLPVAASGGAFAQTFQGNLTGIVTDPSGAVGQILGIRSYDRDQVLRRAS